MVDEHQQFRSGHELPTILPVAYQSFIVRDYEGKSRFRFTFDDKQFMMMGIDIPSWSLKPKILEEDNKLFFINEIGEIEVEVLYGEEGLTIKVRGDPKAEIYIMRQANFPSAKTK